MDDFYVFLKNDRNFFLKQLHFIISLISFLFLILTNTVDSVIVALAIPGTVLNSALLLGLYCLDERHDVTDIEILISYGVLNLLAAMVFVNKTLQMDISIFRMLFLNSYTVNIILCLCSGLLMLGEGIHRLIVILVRNIYTQNSQHLNVLFNGKEQNSSINSSGVHKNNSPDVDTATNTTPSVSNFKPLPNNILSYAEKDTNTNPPSIAIHPAMEAYTDCSHYRLNSEHDKHRNVDRHNSGDNGYISDDGYTDNDRHSGDGVHCTKTYVDHEKPFINEEPPRAQVQNFFYPKSHVTRPVTRHPKNFNGQESSGFNEAGLPVFVDRYGKRYIASLAGAADNHRCATSAAPPGFDTSSGDCKKKASTPIDEYYTNRKYSNSKVTITPSKDEVNTNDGIMADSKIAHDHNINNNKINHNHNNNTNNNNSNNINGRVANNEHTHHSPKNKDKATDSNEFITNYNNYLAHLYKNNTTNDGKKLFNYKFYNHNYDYQWVCEA